MSSIIYSLVLLAVPTIGNADIRSVQNRYLAEFTQTSPKNAFGPDYYFFGLHLAQKDPTLRVHVQRQLRQYGMQLRSAWEKSPPKFILEMAISMVVFAEGHLVFSDVFYHQMVWHIYHHMRSVMQKGGLSPYEKGWVAVAFTAFYRIEKEPYVLAQAQNHARLGIPLDIRHQISLGMSWTSLYLVTAKRYWLNMARELVNAVRKQLDTRAQLTYFSPLDLWMLFRFANNVYHYTNDALAYQTAEIAIQELARMESKQENTSGYGLGYILLAHLEWGQSPLHVTVVGRKKDPKARALFETALRYPALYYRLEWWDNTEGPPPNPDVKYPTSKTAAVFVCTKRQCSLPITDSKRLHMMIQRLVSFPSKGL